MGKKNSKRKRERKCEIITIAIQRVSIKSNLRLSFTIIRRKSLEKCDCKCIHPTTSITRIR
jgi:hypothetical protein